MQLENWSSPAPELPDLDSPIMPIYLSIAGGIYREIQLQHGPARLPGPWHCVLPYQARQHAAVFDPSLESSGPTRLEVNNG